MKNFKIQKNTDGVDIDQKCLGLDAWVCGPDDSLNLLNTNRGLHVQIRHNQDANTLDAASDLANLLAAAPELLDSAYAALDLIKNELGHGEVTDKLIAAINKAKGK